MSISSMEQLAFVIKAESLRATQHRKRPVVISEEWSKALCFKRKITLPTIPVDNTVSLFSYKSSNVQILNGSHYIESETSNVERGHRINQLESLIKARVKSAHGFPTKKQCRSFHLCEIPFFN